MTPKDKAEFLIWNYYNSIQHDYLNNFEEADWQIAANCALSVANEMIKLSNINVDAEAKENDFNYWVEVKNEIEKLKFRK